MKKVYLFMLMAVGLLISGNAGAGNQAKIGSTEYATLQAAFDAAQLSVPTTVTLLEDIAVTYGNPTDAQKKGLTITSGFENVKKVYEIAAYKNIILELNGKKIEGTSVEKSTALFKVVGNLTIQDNTAGENGQGQGLISENAGNPDMSTNNEYANNVFDLVGNSEVGGSLTINSGVCKNLTCIPTGNLGDWGQCTYVVDCSSSAGKTSLVINNGWLYSQQTDAIRMNTKYGTARGELIINGGIVEGWARGILFYIPNNVATPLDFIMNGGVLKANYSGDAYAPHRNCAFVSWNFTENNAADFSKIHITINGGRVEGGLVLHRGGYKTVTTFDEVIAETVEINGGTFTMGYFGIVTDFNTTEHNNPKFPLHSIIKGGTFEWATSDATGGHASKRTAEVRNNHLRDHLVDGHCIGDPFEEGDKTWVTIDACDNATVSESGDWNEKVKKDGEDQVSDNATNVVLNDGVTIEVNNGEVAAANKITNNGEAQIIVHDGAILNVGNGGIVSENNDLVFVKVEAGGKLTIGHGGLDQEGEMYPIIIENDGNNSGTYMVSPDATNTEVTEPEATVRVFTNAYMKSGVNHWQQMACPVNNPQYMNIYKLGEQTEGIPEISTEIYSWDYAEDAWSKLHSFTGNLENPSLETFKAYDLINNSLPTEGGVTYEFKGKLVGNKDMKLTFPEHGYCLFGNSYTAPIDLTVLFEQIATDIATENIDPCVYIFNSKNDRFEEVNALGLYLKSIGIGDVAFTQIPSQQAFIMNLISGSSAETAVDYRNAVWGNTQTTAAPLRAPKNIDVNTVANIVVAGANSQDHVMVVESSQYDAQYDRGADAEKYMDVNHFNLYATTEAGNLAMVATDNLEGTTLTFQAGQEVEYTMTFTNVLNNDYSLIDLLTNEVIRMTEGNSYTFAAQPNSVENRFQIIATAKVPTGVKNTKVVAAKGIYSVMGQYLGEEANWNNMPNGVYVIDGVKVVK